MNSAVVFTLLKRWLHSFLPIVIKTVEYWICAANYTVFAIKGTLGIGRKGESVRETRGNVKEALHISDEDEAETVYRYFAS